MYTTTFSVVDSIPLPVVARPFRFVSSSRRQFSQVTSSPAHEKLSSHSQEASQFTSSSRGASTFTDFVQTPQTLAEILAPPFAHTPRESSQTAKSFHNAVKRERAGKRPG